MTPYSSKPPLSLAGQRYFDKDCLPSYTSNCNFDVKFCSRSSVLRRPLDEIENFKILLFLLEYALTVSFL